MPTEIKGFQREHLIVIGVVVLAWTLLAAGILLKPRPQRVAANGIIPSVSLGSITASTGPACISNLGLVPGTAGLQTKLGVGGAGSQNATFKITDSSGRALRSTELRGISDGTATFRFAPFVKGLVGGTGCFSVTAGSLGFYGTANGQADPSRQFFFGKTIVAGDVTLTMIAQHDRSALATLGTIMRRASLFRPDWVGTWTFYLAFLVALGCIAVLVTMLLRLGRGIAWGRGSMVALALVVFLNAAAWAIVTPAFNVPDELAHFTYVETLAAGHLPQAAGSKGSGNSYLPSTALAANYTAVGIILNPTAHPSWDPAVEKQFESQYKAVLKGPNKPFGITPAYGYSPLYYAPAVIPYKLAGSSGVFGKLLAVRLYSALLVALTALMAVLFARELLPSEPWFGPVAGLAVAFEPMFLHIGGGVNNDNLLTLLATVTLYFCARMLRRGGSAKLALAAGTAFGFGYLAKPTIAGLAPAVAMTFIVVYRRDRDRRTRATRLLELAPAAAVCAAIAAIGTALFHSSTQTVTSLTASGSQAPFSVFNAISYAWQWYLPRLPGMHSYFGGTPPVVSTFVREFIADFNSLDTHFPNWIYGLITVAFVLLVIGAAVTLVQRRATMKQRWPLLALVVLASTGTALFVNAASYLADIHASQSFAQGRYLFPAIGVFGALVAAASLSFGRVRGLLLASTLVLSLAAINIFGMALSIGRFYT